jgi:hypothetical protein
VNDFLKELVGKYGWRKSLIVGSYYKSSKEKLYCDLKPRLDIIVLTKYRNEKGEGLVTDAKLVSPIKDVTDEEFLFFKMNQDKDLTVISYSDMLALIKNI